MLPRRRPTAPGHPGSAAPDRRRAVAPPALSAVLTVVLTALTALTAVGAGAPAAAAAPDDPDQPLRVTLDTLSPAVVPRQGAVQVTGTVINQSDEAWTNVNLYAFSSEQPITTPDELADAVETDPAAEVGPRVIAPNSFVNAGDLDPGQSAGFTLRVPRSTLAIPEDEPGVYWFGVHALGSSEDGRDGLADGRARTFISQGEPDAPQVPVSLVLPLRHAAVYEADGSLDRLPAWVRDLRPGGRLRALLDFASAGSDQSLTFLVDPAVLDAADHLSQGNAPRSLAPTLPEPGDSPGDGATPPGSAQPSEGATETPSGDGSDGSDGSSATPSEGSGETDDDAGGEATPTSLEQRAAALAEVWRDRATRLLGGGEVLALPYADLDVAAALAQQPTAYTRATAFGAETLDRFGVASSPAVAPPDGVADADTIAGLVEGTTALLPERAMEDGTDTDDTVRSIDGRDIVLADEAAVAGGPGPDDPSRTVQVRQRLLAETVLRSLSGAETPTTALLPAGWVPGDARGFFLGLDDAPWIRLATLGAATAGLADDTDPQALAYPEEADEAWVGPRNFAAVAGLTAAGRRLQGVLTRNDVVGDVVAREALGAASYRARDRQVFWRRLTQRSTTRIEGDLGRVRVEAPPSVTLSSEEGKFAASVVNDLDEPVTVRIAARTDGRVEISSPDEIALAPGERTSVLLTATTSRIGLHDVELVVTTPEGLPLGSSAELPIRSAQVSWIIWVVIAIGGSILLGAIVVRLVRRVRARRRPGDPDDARPDRERVGAAGGPA